MATGNAANGDGRAAPEGTGADLKDMLTEVIHRISDSERRNGDLLRQMQDRLETLGADARSARAGVPDAYLPGFDRIEDGLSLLAKRICETYATRGSTFVPSAVLDRSEIAIGHLETTAATAPAPVYVPAAPRAGVQMDGPGISAPFGSVGATDHPHALRSSAPGGFVARNTKVAPHIDTFDVVESLPGNPTEPWSPDQVAALSTLYSTREALFTDPIAFAETHSAGLDTPTTYVAPTGPGFDRDWLDSRLAAVATRIEHSLNAARPDAALTSMDRRLEQFEDQFNDAIRGLATKADVAGLAQIEHQITDLTGQFDAARAELARLDGLEQQLNGIVEQVSDARLGAFVERLPTAAASVQPRADVELHSVAIAAAEAAAARVATNQRDGRVDDVHAMLSDFVQERRHSDEQTANVLDTLQQAMLRMLDRVDQIEGGPVRQTAPHDPHEMYDTPALAAHVPPAAPDAYYRPAQSEAYQPTHAAEPVVDQRVEMQQSVQRAAMAQREKLKAQAAANVAAAASPATVSPGARSAKPAVKTAPKRLMVSGLALAVVIAGSAGAMLALMPRDQGLVVAAPAPGGALPSDPKTVAGGQDMKPKPMSASGGATAGAVSAPVPVRPIGTSAAPMPETVTDDIGQASVAPEIDRAPGLNQARSNIATTAVTTPGPVKGMLIQSSPEAALGSAQSAVLDGTQVMKIAATPSDVTGQAADPQAPVAAGQTRALELPPATVGPLSLRLAAAQGDASAEFEVASRLAEGKGTDQNIPEAVRWYQRSATKGFAQAQYRLGTFFERGLGMKADPARAKAWYQRAADQGNVKAMHNLAVLAAGRAAESPDYKTAAQWFTQAAGYGLADSQFNLAVLTESGLGVEKDMVQAAMWFTLAARSGDKEAIRRAGLMKSKMDKTDLAAADHLVKSWQALTPDKLANDAKFAGEAWKSRQTTATASSDAN
jgi:localization factor PodJL